MNKTVLVVDDDKMLRDALAAGLRKAEFNVISADSAETAFEILNRIKPDAVVLDRMMTGMDGLTFLKEIRNQNNLTPVIMLTAMGGPENTIDGLTSGANDYMAKPFQLQELILRLNNVMKNNNTVSAELSLPDGLTYDNEEFFVNGEMLNLSSEEKKLLQNLVTPIGNIVSATPMVAKRLRNKINGVLSSIDIITVRGMGYKIINNKAVQK